MTLLDNNLNQRIVSTKNKISKDIPQIDGGVYNKSDYQLYY